MFVLGDVATDVLVRPEGPLRHATDTGAEIRQTLGGAGANVARWLARSGREVVLVARVGADVAGRAARATLEEEGVDLDWTLDSAAPTGTVVVLLDEHGERTMLPDRGANLRLRPAHLPLHRFVSGGHLHVSGYTLLHPGPRDAAREALMLARHRGMTISVDPASAGPLRDRGSERFIADASPADVWLPNREEAAVLCGEDPGPAELARRLAGVVPHCVVTDGPEGAWSSDGAPAEHAPAAAVDVVDATGAGDAFTAGWIDAWCAGSPAPEALRAGCALAAVAVAGTGACPAPPGSVSSTLG